MFHMTFNELKYFVHKIHGICVELGLDSAVVYIPKCFYNMFDQQQLKLSIYGERQTFHYLFMNYKL